MFYGDEVQDTRQLFYESWRKYREKNLLSPLEKQLVDVIVEHPEYHAILEERDPNLDKTYLPELGQTNPFLHMGLHLAIREQTSTNRPNGIQKVYQMLLQKHKNKLKVEHLMMDCLAECLWLAQKNNQMPNEETYLNLLKTL